MSEQIFTNHINTINMTVNELTEIGKIIVSWQKLVNWGIGDIAIAAEKLLGENYPQVFPVDVSPGLIQRCKAVSEAYPAIAMRNESATWSVHKNHAKNPDRVEKVQASVDAGRTSDEERKHDGEKRWLLAVDTNYYLCRFWYGGAGLEAASSLSKWVIDTAESLKQKGLSDVVCCFDSETNHRKELTKNWEKKYKDRPPKPEELKDQIRLAEELINKNGIACVSVEGMEADDLLASYAKQFDGRVTILTKDKDCRQCLSKKCNMLLDVKWEEDETTGDKHKEYKWLSAKSHLEETGIKPAQWCDFQSIMGDNADGISGANGIGKKGAADLIKEYGTAQKAIEAAKNGDELISQKRREALIEFGENFDITMKLVTLVDDLTLPESTRI